MSVLSDPTSALVVTTSIVSFLSGFGLGIYALRGSIVSPELAAERHGNLNDPVESEESDIDEEQTLLDHAPNWSNGVDADRKQGLRQGAGAASSAGLSPGIKIDPNEECKLVLVVRTDLGMNKGAFCSSDSGRGSTEPTISPLSVVSATLTDLCVLNTGKMAAQASHATLACYKTLLRAAQASPQSSEAQLLRQWDRRGQAKVAVQIKGEDELLELMGRARSLGVTAEVITDAGRTQIAAGSRTVLGVGPAPKSLVDQITGHLKLL